MPLDIYGSVQSLITKDRAFRIEIDNVYDSPSPRKTIRYHQETLILDGEDGPKVGKADKNPPTIAVNFDSILAKTYTLTDPVTQQEVTISLAAVALAINMDYVARRTYQKQVEELKAQLEAETITQEEYEAAVAALTAP